jgi:hypothetical protein
LIFLPHPNPLPEGEGVSGTAVVHYSMSDALFALLLSNYFRECRDPPHAAGIIFDADIAQGFAGAGKTIGGI